MAKQTKKRAKRPAKRPVKALDPKHEKRDRFVAEYLVDLNATQAAIRSGYSEKTARQQASDILANPDIQEQIDKRRAELSAKLEITQERVLNEMARIAFGDPRRFFDEHGNLKPIKDLDDDAAAILAGMDVEKLFSNRKQIGNTVKIKFWNKVEALEKLARHLGLFKKDNAQVGDAIGKAMYQRIVESGSDTGPGPAKSRQQGA